MIVVGVHLEHAPNFLGFSLELPNTVEGLIGHVVHDFAEKRLSSMAELGVFHGGPGDLGNGTNALHIFRPDLCNATPVRIINTPGASCSNGDELGLRKGGSGKHHDAKDGKHCNGSEQDGLFFDMFHLDFLLMCCGVILRILSLSRGRKRANSPQSSQQREDSLAIRRF